MTSDKERLPRRDWLILPLLSLLSVVLVLGVSEVAARTFWPEHPEDRCAVPDPALGLRFQPNCRSDIKSAESPWVENAYNACGLRTAEPCGPKVPEEFRVSVIGTSISSGYLIPYPQTFAARATAMLERRCRKPVDFQNLAVPGAGQMANVPLHMDAALALQPNLLLMVMSEYDLEVLRDNTAAPAAPPTAAPGPNPVTAFALKAAQSMRASRAVLVAQHFLYQNIDSYLPLYLRHGDEADYLRPPYSPAWRQRLAIFDREINQVAARAAATGVPFLLVYVPARAQVALMRWEHRSSDLDPAMLGQQLGDISRRHGVSFIDLTATMAARPDAAAMYYPVDGHPDAAASAIIADAVVNTLLADDNELAGCRDKAQARK